MSVYRTLQHLHQEQVNWSHWDARFLDVDRAVSADKVNDDVGKPGSAHAAHAVHAVDAGGAEGAASTSIAGHTYGSRGRSGTGPSPPRGHGQGQGSQPLRQPRSVQQSSSPASSSAPGGRSSWTTATVVVGAGRLAGGGGGAARVGEAAHQHCWQQSSWTGGDRRSHGCFTCCEGSTCGPREPEDARESSW